MRGCAAKMVPHRTPPLPPRIQQPKTAGANSKLDKLGHDPLSRRRSIDCLCDLSSLAAAVDVIGTGKHGFEAWRIRDFVKPGCFRSVRLCLGAWTCRGCSGRFCASIVSGPKRKKALCNERAFMLHFFVILVAGAGSNLHLRPEQVKMVAGTGKHHNLLFEADA